MGHACRLSFSPRILSLQEIPTPGPLDTTAAKLRRGESIHRTKEQRGERRGAPSFSRTLRKGWVCDDRHRHAVVHCSRLPSCRAASNVTTAPTICTSSPAVVTAEVPLLGTAHRRDLLLTLLEEVRQRHRFVVLGYVVMPEHFHLLISEPQETTPSIVMQVLKQRFAHQVLRRSRRAQRRGQGLCGRRREKSGSAASTISMSGRSASASRSSATCIGIRSNADWSASPNNGRGAAFATTPSAKRDRYGSTTARCLK